MEIDDILDTVKSTNQDTIEEDIRKKWGDNLKDYYHINNKNTDKLAKGKYIKYVDLGLTKIRYGILTDIITNPYGVAITYLRLKNTRDNTYWKISFNKHHIFQLDRSSDVIRQIFDDLQNNKKLRLKILKERSS